MSRSASPIPASSPTASERGGLSPVPTAELTVTYEAVETVFFPTAPAGIWRGQLGAALHRSASARRRGAGGSTYEQLFRTPRSAVRVPERPARILGPIGLAGEHVPHPFVLRVGPVGHRSAPLRLRAGDATRWSLVLVGSAVRHVPVLTAVLDGLAEGGIGRTVPQPEGPDRRGRMHLQAATLSVGRVSLELYERQAEGTGTWHLPATCDASLYEQMSSLVGTSPSTSTTEAPEEVSVSFETPVRLSHGDAMLRAPSDLTAEALAQATYRRWAALALCYGPEPPSTERLDAARDSFAG